MSFMTLPPEINSLLIFSGAGSAPLLEAATAWDDLASELGNAASSFSSVTSGLAGQAWQGPASQAMAAALSPAQTPQDLLATLPNVGIGNIGNGNIGFGNAGTGVGTTVGQNVGLGNQGEHRHLVTGLFNVQQLLKQL